MKSRSLGLLLLVISLIVGIFAISNIKIHVRFEEFARTENEDFVEGKIIMVPPWNASEESPPRGWVGFNISVTSANKINHEIHGIILPYDEDPNPKLVMRVVNETGLMVLVWDNFDPHTWDTIKVYAAAYLDADAKRLYDNFKFKEIDESPKYIFLFRGLKNETQDRPILISVKETWFEEKTVLEPSTSNILKVFSIAAACIGAVLSLKKGKTKRTRSMKLKTRTSI